MLIKASACSIVAVLGSFGPAYAHTPAACVMHPNQCYKTTSKFAGYTCPEGKKCPPEKAQFREKEKSGVILFAPIGDGKYIISEVTYRKKGTRAPIHVHPFGGQTCVVWGQMTLWLEDVGHTETTTTTKTAGQCYWMPPNQRMSGVNDGPTAAVMLDLFIVEGSEADPKKPDFPIVLVEEGFPNPSTVDTTVVKRDLAALVEEAKKDEVSAPEVLDNRF